MIRFPPPFVHALSFSLQKRVQTRPISMPNMTGRPGWRTLEMNGRCSASYLACTPCVPVFCTLFNRGGTRRASRLPGKGRDHFHCTVEPSPGHNRCRQALEHVFPPNSHDTFCPPICQFPRKHKHFVQDGVRDKQELALGQTGPVLRQTDIVLGINLLFSFNNYTVKSPCSPTVRWTGGVRP